jgi:hypothetical protein
MRADWLDVKGSNFRGRGNRRPAMGATLGGAALSGATFACLSDRTSCRKE